MAVIRRRTERVIIPFKYLEFQHTPPIAKVILAAPLENNRINGAMAEEIRVVCQTIAADDTLGLAGFTGSGGFFSVGRAVPDLAPEREGQVSPFETWITQHQVAAAVASLAVPVLMVINGDALDHGLELALAGDLRVAASNARLGLTDLSRGVLPWDGGTQRLPRLVGQAWARDMILTSRVIDAHQALALGLVNRVIEADRLMAEVRQLADTILMGGPIAARYAKEALRKGMDLSLGQGLGLEADLNVILQSTADRAEGIQSFLQKRQPKFTGR